MALRFLADHCISNYVVQALREEGHEVVRLRDVLPVESPDSMVIIKARAIGAILLSLNGDFADIAAYPPENYKGIVALQMRNHAEILPHILSRLKSYLEQHPGFDHYHGKLFVVDASRIRIRA